MPTVPAPWGYPPLMLLERERDVDSLNELLFFFHIFLVLGFLLFFLRLGKGALMAFVSLGGVLANLFVTKQIHLFSLTITSADVFAIQEMASLNLLQEYFGRESAKKATLVAFLCMGFFALMARIHLLYIPSGEDVMHPAFSQIFSSTPRIVAASIFVFFLVQRIDIYFFSLLQKLLKKKFFSLRVTISLIFTQLLDTLLFGFLGLYGLVANLFHIILLSFLVKLVVIFCSAPFTAFSRWFYKGQE